MRNLMKLMIIPFLALFLFAGGAWALSVDELGDNITIYDGRGTGTDWHGEQEEIEVEPGMQTGSQWDLQGFFLNGNTLSMVGTFDFINGGASNQAPDGIFDPGDIFIDVDGGLNPNGSATTEADEYDYAIILDFSTNAYSVIDLDGAVLNDVHYSQNDMSNPWTYNNGGQMVYSNTFSYGAGAIDEGDQLIGSNVVSGIDLSFLGTDTFVAHYTMECGNDNLMGYANPVPEPATMLLLGVGLIGLAGIGRKKFIK